MQYQQFLRELQRTLLCSTDGSWFVLAEDITEFDKAVVEQSVSAVKLCRCLTAFCCCLYVQATEGKVGCLHMCLQCVLMILPVCSPHTNRTIISVSAISLCRRRLAPLFVLSCLTERSFTRTSNSASVRLQQTSNSATFSKMSDSTYARESAVA